MLSFLLHLRLQFFHSNDKKDEVVCLCEPDSVFYLCVKKFGKLFFVKCSFYFGGDLI